MNTRHDSLHLRSTTDGITSERATRRLARPVKSAVKAGGIGQQNHNLVRIAR